MVTYRAGACDDTHHRNAIEQHTHPTATTKGLQWLSEQLESEGDQRICAASTTWGPASKDWTPAVLLNGDGYTSIRQNPTKSLRRKGEFIALHLPTTSTDMSLRPFPVTDDIPHTDAPPHPPLPQEDLIKAVKTHLKHWTTCIHANAIERLRKVIRGKCADEKAALSGVLSKTHRRRAKAGTAASEVRIGTDEFHPTLRAVLAHGFTIRIDAQASILHHRIDACASILLWGCPT